MRSQRFLLCVKLHSSAFLPEPPQPPPPPPAPTSEHLAPPSKDLRLTDNCNSLHSRLCLLTSHESSFAPVHCGRFASSPTLACLARAELRRRAFFFFLFLSALEVEMCLCLQSGDLSEAQCRGFLRRERKKNRTTQQGDGFDLRGPTDRHPTPQHEVLTAAREELSGC